MLPLLERNLMCVVHAYNKRRQQKCMHIQWCWKKYMWLC